MTASSETKLIASRRRIASSEFSLPSMSSGCARSPWTLVVMSNKAENCHSTNDVRASVSCLHLSTISGVPRNAATCAKTRSFGSKGSVMQAVSKRVDAAMSESISARTLVGIGIGSRNELSGLPLSKSRMSAASGSDAFSKSMFPIRRRISSSAGI